MTLADDVRAVAALRRKVEELDDRAPDAFEAHCYRLDWDALAAAVDLGAAWQEAGAALPVGWDIDRLVRDWDTGGWRASANRGNGALLTVAGPTPTAALRALTVKLKEQP